jgi:hypothetical protein
MSDHTYIIVSCETDSSLQEAINYRSHYSLELQPLTIEQRSSYIKTFFQRFNKVSSKTNKVLNSNPHKFMFKMNRKPVDLFGIRTAFCWGN